MSIEQEKLAKHKRMYKYSIYKRNTIRRRDTIKGNMYIHGVLVLNLNTSLKKILFYTMENMTLCLWEILLSANKGALNVAEVVGSLIWDIFTEVMLHM